MELPLNEWDVALRPGTFLLCESWRNFIGLMNTLADEYDVQKVLFPKDEASILHKEVFGLQSNDMRQKMKRFCDKFVKKHTGLSQYSEYICRDKKAKDEIAMLLTLAYAEDKPTISIVYDTMFACDSFNAYWHNADTNKGKNVSIRNLHNGNIEKYKDFFEIGIPSRDINPITTPIWNTVITKKYCDSLPELSKLSIGEKIARLMQEGTHVARLNGWIEDKKLSSINSDKEKIRCIFRPIKFRHDDAAYLSIDFEKQAFELLDRHGEHICEISYLGEINSGFKTGHNIKLKR